MEKLKKRWGLTSNFQIVMVIVVFAITGSTSAYLAKPILAYLGLSRAHFSEGFWFGGLIYLILYIILILPIYQVLLVSYGWLFGQFEFFWNFEKKFLKRLGLGFLFKKDSTT